MLLKKLKEKSLQDADEWILKRVEHCDPLLIKNTKAILRQEIEIPGLILLCFSLLVYRGVLKESLLSVFVAILSYEKLLEQRKA